ncbi:MAG TPA: alpha/beta fold hydrolase [Bryobacteraceae bacterium]|nr:alpha/beta fold hydrolase [Bryobacteraceae bacterium]
MQLERSEFLHEPVSPNGAGMVLTHGAGGNRRAPLLVAVAEAFCRAGFLVYRYDLPFRQKRTFGPPSPATAESDRAGLREAVEAVRGLVGGRVFLGGHSYGGRQASMLVAEESGAADGLLLLSYPLHPPKKPDQLRTGHLPSLRAPALFVHGTRDDFGTIEELKRAIELIPAPTGLIPVSGAGHDLAKGKFDVEALCPEFGRLTGLQEPSRA